MSSNFFNSEENGTKFIYRELNNRDIYLNIYGVNNYG